MNIQALIVAGKGGHQTQAKKLFMLLQNDGYNVSCLFEDNRCLATVSDRSKDHSVFHPDIILRLFVSLFFALALIIKISVMSTNTKFIFFGPLNNLPLMFLCRIFRCDCIFIESWSRFAHHSKTYKLAKFLRFKLCVQNENLFVNGQNFFVGRLG